MYHRAASSIIYHPSFVFLLSFLLDFTLFFSFCIHLLVVAFVQGSFSLHSLHRFVFIIGLSLRFPKRLASRRNRSPPSPPFPLHHLTSVAATHYTTCSCARSFRASRGAVTALVHRSFVSSFYPFRFPLSLSLICLHPHTQSTQPNPTKANASKFQVYYCISSQTASSSAQLGLAKGHRQRC